MVGQINIDPTMPHGFLSYTRFDDNYLDGGISALRVALEKAVQARTGEPFRIFQDVDDIQPGDIWRKKLDQAIEAAQLFIPILTPNFFTSDFCRREAKAFLDYEARAGRGDLVLPIYLIDADRMDDETQRNADDIARRLHDRQYSDWRPLRFKLQADDTRSRIYDLAGSIATAIARTNDVASGPAVPTTDVEEELSALKDQIAKRDRIIEGERNRNRQLEAEIAKRKDEIDQLAEERATFLGQLEEQAAERPEDETSKKLRARLSKLEQAFTKERAKAKALAKELEASKDEIQQFSMERAFLESDIEDSEKLKERIQELEEEREQEGRQADDYLFEAQRREEQLLDAVQLLSDRFTAVEQAAAKSGSPVGEKLASQPVPKWFAGLLDRLRAISSTSRLNRVLGLPVLAIILGVGIGTLVPSAWFLSSPSAGDTFKDCDVCPELVVIPAGTFLMGSPIGEGSDDEYPQNEVTIGKPFALGRYEVTFDEWDACVEARGCDHEPNDQNWGRGNNPVIDVSWNDVQQYISWLNERTGYIYRLPSEAEWEYAARAGSTTAYPWGDEVGRNRSNCDGCGSRWDDERAAPVGSFEPNQFGLYDMNGNVWERVEDHPSANYKDTPTDGTPWLSASGYIRVARGGSWNLRSDIARSANRGKFENVSRNNYLGFRVAREL